MASQPTSRWYRCDEHRPDEANRHISGDGFLAKCRVVWSESEPHRIRFMITADEVTDENGEKPGMQLVFEGFNMKSANYDPAYFNRLARWLKLHNLPAPELAPIKSRKLADRIASLLK